MTAPSPPVPTEPPATHDRALWVFVLGDMTVFALFFGYVALEHRRDPLGVAEVAAHLVLPIAFVNTLVLLTGSYLVVLGVGAHRAGATQRAARLLLGATATAVVFVALKAVEYAVELGSGGRGGNATFASLSVVVTALHLLHVLVGAGLLGRWRHLARRGEPWAGVARFAGAAAVYWHMVDLLWLVIFSLVYVAGRVA